MPHKGMQDTSKLKALRRAMYKAEKIDMSTILYKLLIKYQACENQLMLFLNIGRPFCEIHHRQCVSSKIS